MLRQAVSLREPPINPHPLCSSVTRRPQKCVRVPNVCFEAEQILLHGKTAPGALRRLGAVLNKTRDPSDAFSRLHPAYRPTASVARPGEAFGFLPLAVGVKRVGRKRERFLFRHVAGPTPETFSPVHAVAFYTTWSNSFTELFSRAVVQLFELWCRTAAGRDPGFTQCPTTVCTVGTSTGQSQGCAQLADEPKEPAWAPSRALRTSRPHEPLTV